MVVVFKDAQGGMRVEPRPVPQMPGELQQIINEMK